MRSWRDGGRALVAALACACGGPDSGPDEGAPPDEPPLGDGTTLEDRACPEESFLDYQNFGSVFFSEYCVGCHSAELPRAMRQDAPEGVDFDGLDKIRERADIIYLRAADAYATMPPVGGPSPDIRVLLGEWLACGAPE